jgi:hypothetical protein
MNKIDWNKPYSEIVGVIEDKPGAKYSQNNNYYKANGDLISFSKDIDKSWVESQKGLSGRNNLINKAKSFGLEVLKTDSIIELKEKLISRL